MINNLSDFIKISAERAPESLAVIFKIEEMTYGALYDDVRAFGQGLLNYGLQKSDRVALYLPKQLEAVMSIFGPAYAGGVFVPINPGLKARQVTYIMKDCSVRYLVTNADRLASLQEELVECRDLDKIILVGKMPADDTDLMRLFGKKIIRYTDFLRQGRLLSLPIYDVVDRDMVAILYTSGSTGMPKGVMLSHRNMIIGAQSVASYLKNSAQDRILSVLPLSFDAGLSQLTTGFFVGAAVVLMNYLLPRDVIRYAEKYKITGITCVPPLMIQLVGMDWPESVVKSMRYIATTGGRMPVSVTQKLQKILPKSDIYLMYGLTEAFRSTYLPPWEVSRIPHSIGKAIPNAEILVVREDGTVCGTGEEGELVHLGPLVGMGYWNDPKRTKERYRPKPVGVFNKKPELGQQSDQVEMAVWSGDRVVCDKDGYLFFVGRRDEMIKTSGYRVSPTEVEEIIYASGLVDQIAAIGIEHERLGQIIWVIITPKDGRAMDLNGIMKHCRAEMPNYMVPQRLIEWAILPKNPNGKIDRNAILEALKREEEI